MALSKKEIAKFKEQLEHLRAQIMRTFEESSKEVKSPEESKGYSQHQADEGTDDFYRQITIQLSGEETQVLKRIDHALKKIEEGTYGICDVTGKPINKKRLEAIPYASMTVEAQEQQEKQQRY
jgi:DnaK suppressor protein